MRIAVFIDGSNYYYMQKEMGWYIAGEKLMKYFAKQGQLVDAFYYIGESPEDDDGSKRYLDMLNHIGFSLVTKPVKVITDSAGTTFKKANMDVEIVTDMLTLSDNYDVAVLVSGDSDFLKALNILRAKGKVVEVFSTPGIISKELRRFCGVHYTDINTLQDELERDW